MRHLVSLLKDESPAVAVTAVHALRRLEEPSGLMPLYEFTHDEAADPLVRRAAAEALVTVGLLRRPRAGASPMFLWLAGMTLVIVSVAAASTIGPAAIAVFVGGAAALVAFALRETRKGRVTSDFYVGPHGEEIRVPTYRRRDELVAGGGVGAEWAGGGGDAGGGGNAGGSNGAG